MVEAQPRRCAHTLAGSAESFALVEAHRSAIVGVDLQPHACRRPRLGVVEKGATDYSDSISWVILLTLLRAPRWMPYPGRGRVERARDYLREEVERMVAARRRSDQGRNDLVARLLAATDPETGRSMSDRDVVDNLLTFLVAGHETTALA